MPTPPVAGVLAWYAADQITSPPASGSALSSWNDLSGNGYTASQGTGAAQPIYQTNQLNGLPAVSFDGTDDSLSATIASLSQPFTVFAVAARIGTSTICVWSSGGSTAYFILDYTTNQAADLATSGGGAGPALTGVAAGAYAYYSGVADGAASLSRVNGSQIATGNLGSTAFGTVLVLGALGAGSYLSGDIAEILVYPAALDSTDIDTVEAYLYDKWFVAAVPSNTVAPVITGNTWAGQTLSSTTGTWTASPTSYTYQWYRGASAISGATSSTYTLVTADIGDNITCQVVASNGNGAGTAAASNSLGPITGVTNLTAPAVTGSTWVGQVLTTTNGTWQGTATLAYTYQWQRNATNITGATASTYTLQTADIGDDVSCVVTATNSYANASESSNSLGPITTPPAVPVDTTAPVVSGGTIVGQILSSTTGTWTQTPTGYTYQWYRGAAAISGATASTYTLQTADIGDLISCQVIASNGVGSGSPAASNALGPITGPPVAPTVQGPTPPRGTVRNPFTYPALDLLTGAPIDTIPYQAVTFGRTINQPGSWAGGLPLAGMTDPVTFAQKYAWQRATQTTTTALFVDLAGTLIWGGIIWTQGYDSSDPTKTLKVGAQTFESFFQHRIQTFDYGATWAAGADPMAVVQTICNDALTAGNVLSAGGGITVVLHPSGGEGGPQITPSYPGTALQTVDSIVSILSQMGYGIGFDYTFDFAYLPGTQTPAVTMNIWFPRKGRSAAQSRLVLMAKDCTYTYPVDGTQRATQFSETGSGTGTSSPATASVELADVPLWQRTIARSQINDEGTLAQVTLGDLFLNMWPAVAPTWTIPLPPPDPDTGQVPPEAPFPLGTFDAGDDFMFRIDPVAGGGENIDPRFPQGHRFEWRINQWQVTVADKGVSQLVLTGGVPPGVFPSPQPPGT